MNTRNAMQLKALINNKAKAAHVSPQLMLQNYMLERLIDRISRSSWRDYIIVKGGMLIGSLIGVDRRTTKDLDMTVRGFTLTHEKNSWGAIKHREELIDSMYGDDGLEHQWQTYASKHSYATNITFQETLDAVRDLTSVVFT